MFPTARDSNESDELILDNDINVIQAISSFEDCRKKLTLWMNVVGRSNLALGFETMADLKL